MSEVYNVSSTLELTMDALHSFIEGQSDLPDNIDALERDRRNSKFHVKAINPDVGEYTPTARLVGTVRERIVVVGDDGELTHETVHQHQSRQAGWTEPPAAESLDTTTVEYVKFHGEGDDILRNTTLRGEMFQILCQLTSVAHSGYVEGVEVTEEGLNPVRYSAEDGEVPVEMSIQAVAEQSDSEVGSQQARTDESADKPTWTSYS